MERQLRSTKDWKKLCLSTIKYPLWGSHRSADGLCPGRMRLAAINVRSKTNLIGRLLQHMECNRADLHLLWSVTLLKGGSKRMTPSLRLMLVEMPSCTPGICASFSPNPMCYGA